jgi:ATP-dependent helicase/nuclease subunit B
VELMRVQIGLEWGGATNVGTEALALGGARLGEVTWGPSQLLRDLELRLGLTQRVEPQALRVARWQTRVAELAERGRYYSRSFEVDPLGTAEVLLALRDALVEAGWDGQTLEGGGKRLEALHELELVDSAPLPFGSAERLAAVHLALQAAPRKLYVELALAESVELWPARWQGVFRILERAGTTLARLRRPLPGAPPESDLGRLQAALLTPRSGPTTAQGDGSLVHLTAETSWEAACAAAAVVATLPAQRVMVVREGDRAALDGAFGAHGLRTQGLASEGLWHSAAQVLPLALELAFEPKDPSHVLELLTLPRGPFQGRVGHALARVLGNAPGIGGPRWEAAKAALRGGDEPSPDRDRSVKMVEEWLESRGVGPSERAPKANLLVVVGRVRSWVLSRIAATPDDVTLLGAAQHASALISALEGDPRESFSLAEVRKLVATVLAATTTVEVVPEQAGRLEHVACAAGLWAPWPIVVWWGFDDHASGSMRAPWRRSELAALSRVGVTFPEPLALLAERAAAARRTFACATERVIFVSARSTRGHVAGNHPLWDELSARLDPASLSRLTVASPELLREDASRLLAPAILQRPSVSLPGGRLEWTPSCEIAPLQRFSYGSLDALLGCPLQWLLRYRAGTYPGGHALPPLFQLNGSLGHRLIEVLHQRGELELPEAELRERCLSILSELYEREGALLLRAGMGFERTQLERQLIGSVVELARSLGDARLQIVAVEHPLDVTYGTLQLEGRIDLVVAHADGAYGIIDLKWGIASYRDKLEMGGALQLALYAFAHAAQRGAAELPEAAYFSLKQGKLFGLSSRLLAGAEVIAGPSLADTWARAERSLGRAQQAIAARIFPVTGLRRSLPVASALGVPEAEHAAHFTPGSGEACKHCGFDALCGRRWEELS